MGPRDAVVTCVEPHCAAPSSPRPFGPSKSSLLAASVSVLRRRPCAPASNPAWECSMNVRGMPHARLEYRNETDSAEVERSNGAKYSAKRVHRPETAARSARRRPHPVRWNWVRGWGDPLMGVVLATHPGGARCQAVAVRRGSGGQSVSPAARHPGTGSGTPRSLLDRWCVGGGSVPPPTLFLVLLGARRGDVRWGEA